MIQVPDDTFKVLVRLIRASKDHLVNSLKEKPTIYDSALLGAAIEDAVLLAEDISHMNDLGVNKKL